MQGCQLGADISKLFEEVDALAMVLSKKYLACTCSSCPSGGEVRGLNAI